MRDLALDSADRRHENCTVPPEPVLLTAETLASFAPPHECIDMVDVPNVLNRLASRGSDGARVHNECEASKPRFRLFQTVPDI